MNARKTEIAMEDCIKSDLERVGEEWKNDRQNELETADSERSKKNVREKTQWKRNSCFYFPEHEWNSY